MKTIRITAHVEKGQVIPDNPRNWNTAKFCHEGKRVVVSIGPITKQRTLPQNSWLWAGPYAAIASETGNDVEDVHNTLKEMFLKEPGSGPIFKIRSTTSLTTAEFSEYVEKIVMWAAEFLGLYIEMPSEQELLNWVEERTCKQRKS